MKKLLFIFLLLPAFANGQFGPFGITFDPTDTLYSRLIVIDTVNYHHNIWQIGKPHKTVFDSAYSYPNAIVTDTLNPYPPNDTSVFYIKISGDYYGWWVGLISFRYQLDIDSGSHGAIDVSFDNGITWMNILSAPNQYYLMPDTPSLSIATTGWAQWGIGHDFQLCDTFIFRFSFISDSVTTTKNGWIIDNINLGYTVENVPQIRNDNQISTYPNPTTTSLTISSSEKITTISITNLLGQTLYTHEYNSEKVQVDVSPLRTGVYFVKVNGTVVRKFLKE